MTDEEYLRNLIEDAKSGDKKALAETLDIAASMLRRGEDMPRRLRLYISASFRRRAEGLRMEAIPGTANTEHDPEDLFSECGPRQKPTNWTEAFSPLKGKAGAEQRKLLAIGKDILLKFAVEQTIDKKKGITTSRADGSPGKVFEIVGEIFSISPLTARNRYYKIKKRMEGQKLPGSKKHRKKTVIQLRCHTS